MEASSLKQKQRDKNRCAVFVLSKKRAIKDKVVRLICNYSVIVVIARAFLFSLAPPARAGVPEAICFQ
jgi:hypothetical protein